MAGDVQSQGFGARVAAAIDRTGPLCAGIDPSDALLEAWGLDHDAAGLREFGTRCVEAFAGVVPVVKPQVAFFERFGAAGIAVLESLIREAQAAGLLVIADAKRGDIGSTMEAYASTWLDPRSPLYADAVTATPYLGLGSLQPMFDLASEHGGGVIVVVRTSNPEGRALQESLTDSGRGPAVEDMLLGRIAELNAGGLPLPGTVGAVVGATLAPSAFPLSSLGGPILAPGVGAQGATADDVGRLFSGCKPGSVLASSSRSLLATGPEPSSLRAAALASRDEMAAALG
ncbi:MAG TPA: orotidine-5'-phosphate decarboxylase [Acidimicrobiales bacterium]|jgi:orotidine-5'-phosphate decarboxylase|nr:orotidine-5'-phosphate decarboxylase [Acidimicrobiales bacterium]